MRYIKNFADFVNESIQSQDINEGKFTGKEEIKKLEKAMSDMQDALNNANWKDLEKHAEKAKWWAHVLNSMKFESSVEESKTDNDFKLGDHVLVTYNKKKGKIITHPDLKKGKAFIQYDDNKNIETGREMVFFDKMKKI